MSIERIRDYLIENAQKESEQIIKTAEGQFRTQAEAAKSSLEKQYQELLHREEEHISKDIKNALISLKREHRMKLLEMKNHAIDSVLIRAINRIQSLPDNDYLALIGKWLAKIPNHLEGRLFINARDVKRITHAFIDAVNKDRKAKFILDTTVIDINGGFILRTEYYEIDYSLDTLAKNLHATLAPKLGDILRLSDAEM